MNATETKAYATRSAAIRAARLACKRALGPSYDAHEGPDYIVFPASADVAETFPRWGYSSTYSGPSCFQLRGPAAEGLR